MAGGRRSEGTPDGTKLTPDGGVMRGSGSMMAAATVSDLAGDAVAAVLHEPMQRQSWECWDCEGDESWC